MNSQPIHIPDEELLSRYRRDGDNDWLGILLQRYTIILYGVCLKYLKDEENARDAVQQIFFKALSEIEKQYQIDNFGGWLYRIAVNYCFTVLREKKVVKGDDFILSNLIEDEQQDLQWHWDKVKEADHLNNALSYLKTEQQQCIRLFYYDKKSYKEISEQTGFSINEVKSHIQNGKRNLKLRLEK